MGPSYPEKAEFRHENVLGIMLSGTANTMRQFPKVVMGEVRKKTKKVPIPKTKSYWGCVVCGKANKHGHANNPNTTPPSNCRVSVTDTSMWEIFFGILEFVCECTLWSTQHSLFISFWTPVLLLLMQKQQLSSS